MLSETELTVTIARCPCSTFEISVSDNFITTSVFESAEIIRVGDEAPPVRAILLIDTVDPLVIARFSMVPATGAVTIASWVALYRLYVDATRDLAC